MASKKPRARDLGIPFEGKTGQLNAITDVPGVEVGYCTIIEGSGPGKEIGKGPIRTGVTAILPRGKERSFADTVFAGWTSLNGNGELTGAHMIEEWGFMQGPFMITNACSVGIVRDAVDQWAVQHGVLHIHLSTVAETSDQHLNDIHGFHVTKDHAFSAISSATSGPIEEGNVGGGTGMICYGFKGGTGTSSRIARLEQKSYIVGVLAQTNHGNPQELTVAGVPVGLELPPDLGYFRGTKPSITEKVGEKSSIIIVAATDAPLLPHQLKRVARRISMGLARTGSISSNGSGDIFLAFSTANPEVDKMSGEVSVKMIPNREMNSIFQATIQATEEAIINSMVAAETTIGFEGQINALPHDLLITAMKKYNRFSELAP